MNFQFLSIVSTLKGAGGRGGRRRGEGEEGRRGGGEEGRGGEGGEDYFEIPVIESENLKFVARTVDTLSSALYIATCNSELRLTLWFWSHDNHFLEFASRPR